MTKLILWLKLWMMNTAKLFRWVIRIGLIIGIAWIMLAVMMQWIAAPDKTVIELEKGEGRQLVVVVHGLSGREAIQPTVDLAGGIFPKADLLTIDYDARLPSNADVFDIANRLETAIYEAHRDANYQSIVLLGHSMGAMLVRKALLWGSGIEQDRKAKKGAREWVTRVERVVSLAGINRGWSIEPKPDKMALWKYTAIWLGETVARLTGTGKMLLSMQRGSAFVADSRVQWIHYARQPVPEGTRRHLPQVIHLLGDRDDIVAREDAQDLSVAKDTIFVSLPDTDHASIAEAVRGGQGEGSDDRRAAISNALLGKIENLSPDKAQELKENRKVKRVIYVMHGIRDYGEWTDKVRSAIEKRIKFDPSIVVINKKYGYFPMLRFLMYWDRHKNVRRLMDEYTENLAQYPNAESFDFAGHSNGTYLLASALQHYKTMSVGRAFFAGSVVPKHYPWQPLLDAERVEKVVNVVADGDWVVGIFPRLFEQFADWLTVQPTIGVLDLGSAGFRGFEGSADPKGRVRNLTFVHGGHGAGVDVSNGDKLAAIVEYLVTGELKDEGVFEDAQSPVGWLDIASNVSWLIWIVLGGIVMSLIALAFMLHRTVGVVSVLVVFALLMSV